MSELHFRLPWPPSANTLYATVKGRRVLSRKGREYKRIVQQQLNYQYKPLSCRLSAYLYLVEPDRRRRDIANVEKIIMDSLQQAGVMEDDSQIDELYLSRLAVSKYYAHVRVALKECIFMQQGYHRSIEETISA